VAARQRKKSVRLTTAGSGRSAGLNKRQSRKARRTISMMKRATRANMEDCYRNGSMIEFPIKGELMIAGDLHGNKRNYDRLLEIADLENQPQRHLILQEVVHSLELSAGGRDMSFLLLEKLAELKVEFPDRVHILLGNHELSEFQGRKVYKDGKMLNALFSRGIAASYGPDAAAVKEAYRKFYRTIPLAARTETKLFFCHSTPEGDQVRRFKLDFFRQAPNLYDVVAKQMVEDLVWGRDYEPEIAEIWCENMACEVIVVGHDPCDDGYRIPNDRHIIIDAKDENAVYMLFKLNQPYSQKGLIKKIKRLWT